MGGVTTIRILPNAAMRQPSRTAEPGGVCKPGVGPRLAAAIHDGAKDVAYGDETIE